MKRHQRKEKWLFWHIDYLLNNEAKIIKVFNKLGERKNVKSLSCLELTVCQFTVSDAQIADATAIFIGLQDSVFSRKVCNG